jgi:hypothetical protein
MEDRRRAREDRVQPIRLSVLTDFTKALKADKTLAERVKLHLMSRQ